MEVNDKIYDIAIIGLGPAGSTFARLLDNEFTVIAFDKKYTYNDGFSKPCGGLLSEDAQEMFGKLNLAIPREIFAEQQMFSVKTIDITNKKTKIYK